MDRTSNSYAGCAATLKPRRDWVRPEVKTIRAGAAEAGTRLINQDGFSRS